MTARRASTSPRLSPLTRAVCLAVALFACLALPVSGQSRRSTFDFTADGTSDLLFINDLLAGSGRSLAYWDFDSNGAINVRYLGTITGDVVGAGDYNGDGTSDVLTRQPLTGAIGYWPVRNGMLDAFVLLVADTSPNWHVVGSRQRTDFNGDGRDDILWRHDAGTMGIYQMSNMPAAFTWVPLDAYPRDWTVIGTGDFDGDGRDDALWRHETSGDVRFMRILDSGVTWTDLGTRAIGSRIRAIADLDGDRTDDVYWTFSPQATPDSAGWWDINAGAVVAFNAVPLSTPFNYNGVQASGDYLGDGSDDLVDHYLAPIFGATTPWAQRRNFLNGSQTDTTFLLAFSSDWAFVPSMQSAPLGPPPRARRAAYDFTGDGTSDLLFRDASGQLLFWDMGGTPLAAQQRVPLLAVGPEWEIAGVADYDGDRTSDILFRHMTTGAVGYWKMSRGAMVAFVPLDWSLSLQWQVVSSRKRSDLDGDGRDDILLRDANGTFAMMLVTGPGPLAVRWVDLGPSDPAWGVVGTADFTGDGRADVLLRHASTGAVGYVRMGPFGFAAWVPLIASLDFSWTVGTLADFNGDGFDDIYWRAPGGPIEGYWNLADGALSGFVSNALATTFPGYVTIGFTSGDYAGDGSEDVGAMFNTGVNPDRLGWLLFTEGRTTGIGNGELAGGFVLQ